MLTLTLNSSVTQLERKIDFLLNENESIFCIDYCKHSKLSIFLFLFF